MSEQRNYIRERPWKSSNYHLFLTVCRLFGAKQGEMCWITLRSGQSNALCRRRQGQMTEKIRHVKQVHTHKSVTLLANYSPFPSYLLFPRLSFSLHHVISPSLLSVNDHSSSVSQTLTGWTWAPNMPGYILTDRMGLCTNRQTSRQRDKPQHSRHMWTTREIIISQTDSVCVE